MNCLSEVTQATDLKADEPTAEVNRNSHSLAVASTTPKERREVMPRRNNYSEAIIAVILLSCTALALASDSSIFLFHQLYYNGNYTEFSTKGFAGDCTKKSTSILPPVVATIIKPFYDTRTPIGPGQLEGEILSTLGSRTGDLSCAILSIRPDLDPAHNYNIIKCLFISNMKSITVKSSFVDAAVDEIGQRLLIATTQVVRLDTCRPRALVYDFSGNLITSFNFSSVYVPTYAFECSINVAISSYNHVAFFEGLVANRTRVAAYNISDGNYTFMHSFETSNVIFPSIIEPVINFLASIISPLNINAVAIQMRNIFTGELLPTIPISGPSSGAISAAQFRAGFIACTYGTNITANCSVYRFGVSTTVTPTFPVGYSIENLEIQTSFLEDIFCIEASNSSHSSLNCASAIQAPSTVIPNVTHTNAFLLASKLTPDARICAYDITNDGSISLNCAEVAVNFASSPFNWTLFPVGNHSLAATYRFGYPFVPDERVTAQFTVVASGAPLSFLTTPVNNSLKQILGSVNADMSNPFVLDGSSIPLGSSLSIFASDPIKTPPAPFEPPIDNVEFNLDNNAFIKVEGIVPYALFGDNPVLPNLYNVKPLRADETGSFGGDFFQDPSIVFSPDYSILCMAGFSINGTVRSTSLQCTLGPATFFFSPGVSNGFDQELQALAGGVSIPPNRVICQESQFVGFNRTCVDLTWILDGVSQNNSVINVSVPTIVNGNFSVGPSSQLILPSTSSLNISGDLVLESDATLVLEGRFNSAPILIGGCANLSGTLIINSTSVKPGDEIEVLRSGCVIGQFNRVETTNECLDATPSVRANIVTVAFSLSPTCQTSLSPSTTTNYMATLLLLGVSTTAAPWSNLVSLLS